MAKRESDKERQKEKILKKYGGTAWKNVFLFFFFFILSLFFILILFSFSMMFTGYGKIW